MLLVFTLCITPKQALHQWLANHTDSAGKGHEDLSKAQLTEPGKYCECSSLVVEKPYCQENIKPDFQIRKVYFEKRFSNVTDFSSKVIFSSHLRGPPSSSLI